MKGYFLDIFPEDIKRKIQSFKISQVQEIRVRVNKPLIICSENKEYVLNKIVNSDDLKHIVQRISNYSLYAYEEEIKQGFLTLKGGHRVGIAGECVMSKEGVKTIKNISSLNVRITKEVIGCSKEVIKHLIERDKVKNTLIISPPKCGKTTMLRDITRVLSSGNESIGLKGKKVVVIDERSEICGSYLGIPQMDVGMRTDVLDNCSKKEGMIMAIRSLSPEVLICDEIGSSGDIEALQTAFNSGVNVVVTVHGNGLDDILMRDGFKKLIKNRIIDTIILLGNRNKVGELIQVYSYNEKGEYICLK